ncbi:MAG: ABC transporter permease subunit [Gammaproteobacteria bacterium]
MRPSSPNEGRGWRWLLAGMVGGNLLLALGLAGAQSLGLASWPPSALLDTRGWRALVGADAFWHSLLFSATLAAVTLALALVAALLLQHALGAELRRARLTRLLYLPLAVPGVAAGLLAFIMLGDSGVLSRVGHALGLVTTPADFPALLFDADGRGIVLTHLALITPLFLLLFARLAEPLRLPALLEQARALGASPWSAWRRVALPLLLRQSAPVIAVYGLALIGAYEIPLMLGGARPPMVSVAIAEAVQGYDLASRPYGYAMACAYLGLLALAWALVMKLGPARDTDHAP